jgi:hypothetical protein
MIWCCPSSRTSGWRKSHRCAGFAPSSRAAIVCCCTGSTGWRQASWADSGPNSHAADPGPNWSPERFFFLGRHDRHVGVGSELLETLRGPMKVLYWFERSAHNVPTSHASSIMSASCKRFTRSSRDRLGDDRILKLLGK